MTEAAPATAVLVLTPVEARVVGSLVEKAFTTPNQYPLSLNALVAACNQQSNRDPVVTYDEATVDAALTSLRAKGVVRLVHPSHGARTPKHRHVLDEALGLDPAAVALVAVLLLRGAQTLAELRTRTERMHPFATTDEVEHVLEFLAGREPPLVTRVERKPGQKEGRWDHLLGVRRAFSVSAPDYVIPVVDDLQRTIEFWTTTVGLRLEHRDDGFALFDTGTTRVAFLTRAAMASVLGAATDDTFEIGFKVADCDAAYAELIEMGAASACEPTTRAWGQRTAYVRDPSGVLIEICEDLPKDGQVAG